jgi:hypothetical protein
MVQNHNRQSYHFWSVLMNKPDQITYRDWMKIYRVDMHQCPTCSGEGETRCECCGHNHGCEACGGTGLVMLDGNAPMSAYIAQVSRELSIYEQLIGSPRNGNETTETA